jgi:coenzyme F420-0:L-glutamate ligase/coenzyme F420-1:gamma-L-glutamate ligase
VVAQKIVSKAEGRQVELARVTPSSEARRLAAETDKDPALCQLILDESATVLRKKPGVIIVRHRLGHVGANAGIDQSNIEHADGDSALLLPLDPDASARRLREAIGTAGGCKIGVIIADSMNRPWRLGTIGGAIGCAGVEVLDDLRGGADMFGRELKVAMVNRADSLAATATLLMGETVEGTPAVLVRGLLPVDTTQTTADMMRPLEEDLFT